MMDLVLADTEWHVHVGTSYTPPAALGFINNVLLKLSVYRKISRVTISGWANCVCQVILPFILSGSYIVEMRHCLLS